MYSMTSQKRSELYTTFIHYLSICGYSVLKRKNLCKSNTREPLGFTALFGTGKIVEIAEYPEQYPRPMLSKYKCMTKANERRLYFDLWLWGWLEIIISGTQVADGRPGNSRSNS